MEIIAVSACLLGVNVKYSGGNNYTEKLKKYTEGKIVLPICPEVLGGLPIPRDPSEIDKSTGKIYSSKGKDVTENFIDGANKTLRMLKHFNVKTVILKDRSPSCGVTGVYDGTFSNNVIEGMGVTAKLLKNEGIEVIYL